MRKLKPVDAAVLSATMTARESPDAQFVVENQGYLSRHIVLSASHLASLMYEGVVMRAIAANERSATPSKAHMLLTISLTQKVFFVIVPFTYSRQFLIALVLFADADGVWSCPCGEDGLYDVCGCGWQR